MTTDDGQSEFKNRWKDADAGVKLREDGTVVSFDRTDSDSDSEE